MSADPPNQHDLVEDLVFQCLEGLGARGPSAIDEVLAQQPETVRCEVRRMLATLVRVGLAGDTGTDAEATAPEQLGPYRLFERIGAGAMGVVYRARRAGREDAQDLALKLLQPGLLPMRGTRMRFQREIAALRELDHPGICPFLDAGEVEGVPFLVMPFVPGESLRQVFARGAAGADPQRRALLLQVMQQVALALHHAHEHGFVHRDVKPANVIVRPDGHPVLLDFGLARLEQPAPGSALTVSGGVVGTPAYMAPEQVAGRSDIDRRCDVYALGAMLYEGLTGRRPHEAPTRESLYRRILTGIVAPPSRRLRGVPSDLDVVCLTALERERPHRYQTASDLADDLQSVQQGQRPMARLPGPVLRARRWIRRNPLPSGLLMLLLAMLSGLLLQHLDLRRISRTDRARSMAVDAMQFIGSDPDRTLALALGAHDLHPVPETLTAIQAALDAVANRAEYTLDGKGAGVTALAFAADGARLVFATADGKARIWDLAANSVRPLPYSGGVDAIACQPGGDLVATGGLDDGLVCVWSLRTGELVWVVHAHPAGHAVRVLQWSPDGLLLLSGGGEAMARVWTAAGDRRAELPGEGSKLHAGAWLDGVTVAIGTGPDPGEGGFLRHHLRSWRVPADGAPESGPVISHPEAIVAIHAHPLRRDRALVMTTQRMGYLWNAERGELSKQLEPNMYPSRGAGWSPDGAHAFAAASRSGGWTSTGPNEAVWMWNADGELVDSVDGATTVAFAVANPTRPWFAICGGGNVRVMTYDGNRVRNLDNGQLCDKPLAFSSDGSLLAATTLKGGVMVFRVWDPELPLFGTGRTPYGTWLDAGGTIVTGGGWTIGQRTQQGFVKTWDAATGLLLDQFDLDQEVIGLFASRTCERLVAILGRRGQARAAVILRRGSDGWKLEQTLPHSTLGPDLRHAHFAGDDQVLLADSAGRMMVWSLDANRATRHLPAADAGSGPEAIYGRRFAVAATPDASTVWAGGTPGYLHQFDRRVDGSYVEAVPVRVGPIKAMSCLPDGSLLVAGVGDLLQLRRSDGEVVLFTGRRETVLEVDRTTVFDVDWTTLDGETIVTSLDEKGRVRLWRDDGTLVREIQLDGPGRSVRFSANGTKLLTTLQFGIAQIWPVRTADLLALARSRVRR